MIGGLHCYQEGFFADSVNVLLENGEWDLFIIVLYFGSRFLVRMLELVSMDFSDSSFLPQKSVGRPPVVTCWDSEFQLGRWR